MRTVLLIEPHVDTRDLYSEYLRWSGFHVRATGTTPGNALAAEADAVVLCVSHRDSEERMAFVRAVRQAPQGGRVAILAVSSAVQPVDLLAARAAGCDVYLTKPCMPVDLAFQVRRAILQRRRAWARSRRPSAAVSRAPAVRRERAAPWSAALPPTVRRPSV